VNAKAIDTKEDKTQELREKLYLAAKTSKTRRFHALYDKVYRLDFLKNAWSQVKRNKGSAGVDGESIEDIVMKGEDEVLLEIQQTLERNEYRPRSVKRVYIPKPDGRKRPLGIPTVRDRIVQASVKALIEPIFEAEFLDCSYGFRPKRNAHDAIEEIRKTTNAGFKVILDADIKGYFDNINHERLRGFVEQRINDRRVLKLIRKWLECGVIEADGFHETDLGTPQGGVISPLLANIYLHEFDKFWTEQKLVEGKLIRYADDFIILFRTEQEAEKGMLLVKSKLRELGLELNEKKTKIVNTLNGKEGFEFLGFHHRRVMSRKYRKYFTQQWPSQKSMNRLRSKVREVLDLRVTLPWTIDAVVERLNPILRGWMNYFKYGNSARKFNLIDRYIQERLALWWSKKHHKSGRRWGTDFTYKKYKESGVQILSGNVVYWSKRSKAQG
jgi:group II intron reverse transcriptase/maturase